MSEERITALEVGHAQLRKDLSAVAVSQKELYKQQSILDKSVNALIIKLDAHFIEEREYEKTIRNIDNTVNKISIKLASEPMERHNQVQTIVDPLFKNMRDQEKKFSECGEHIKTDLRKEARSHLIIIWFAVCALGIMGGYVLNIAKNDILDTQAENKELILGHIYENSNSNRAYKE